MEFAGKILLNSTTYRTEEKPIFLVQMNRRELSFETTYDYEKAPNFTISEANELLKNKVFRSVLHKVNNEQKRRWKKRLKPCLFTKGRYEENPENRLLMQSLLWHAYYTPSSFRLADRISFELK